MTIDSHRERDLADLGVTAHVDSDGDIVTVKLTTAAFDRLVNAVPEAPWYDAVKDSLDEAEAALRDAAYEIRRATRKPAAKGAER